MRALGKILNLINAVASILIILIGVCGLVASMLVYKEMSALPIAAVSILICIGAFLLLLGTKKTALIGTILCLSAALIAIISDVFEGSDVQGSDVLFIFIPFLLGLLRYVSLRSGMVNEKVRKRAGMRPIVKIGDETYDLSEEVLTLSIGFRGHVAQFYDDIELLGIWTAPGWIKDPQLIPISYNQIKGCKLNKKRSRDYVLGDKVSQLYAVLTVDGPYGPVQYVDFLGAESKAPKEGSRAWARCLTNADKFVSKVQLIRSKAFKYNR